MHYVHLDFINGKVFRTKGTLMEVYSISMIAKNRIEYMTENKLHNRKEIDADRHHLGSLVKTSSWKIHRKCTLSTRVGNRFIVQNLNL